MRVAFDTILFVMKKPSGKRVQKTVRRARQLRDRETPMEKLLWKKLRNRRFHELKFRRQVPIGPYIADFYCFEKQLIVEVDGWIHAYQKEYDERREEYLRKEGYMVIRVENKLVRNWLPIALEKIGRAVGIDYENME